jgi:hypothetical protein
MMFSLHQAVHPNSVGPIRLRLLCKHEQASEWKSRVHSRSRGPAPSIQRPSRGREATASEIHAGFAHVHQLTICVK